MEYDEINPNDILVFAFNEKNPNYTHAIEYNMQFLHFQMAQANMLFRAQGHLFVNHVLEHMGFDPIPEGQLVGWTHKMSQWPNIQIVLEPLSIRMETDGFVWNKIGAK